MMLILLNPLSRPDPSSHPTDRMKSLVLSSTAAVSGSGSPPVYPSAIRRHNGDTVSLVILTCSISNLHCSKED